MKSRRLYLLLGVPFLLTACEREESFEMVDTERAYETPAPGVEPMSPASTAGTSSVIVQPTNDSNVSGQISVAARGQETMLSGNLTGIAPGESIFGHVHRGSCSTMQLDSDGPADFGPVSIGEGGTLEATIPLSLEELNRGEYAIGFHREEATPHIACAEFHRAI